MSADYEIDSYNYSEWTHGIDYSTDLTIGGHNLFRELEEQDGQYLILIVCIAENIKEENDLNER